MQEALDGGQLDLLKGSFYANPMQDNEDMEAHLRQQYPSYCRQFTFPQLAARYTLLPSMLSNTLRRSLHA